MSKKKAAVQGVDKTVKNTAQETIPILSVLTDDGIIEIAPGLYSKSYAFNDINYQIAQESEQTNMFEKYRDFLNTFDANVMIQITLNNRNMDQQKFAKTILLRETGDNLDYLRREYNEEILLKKIQEGKNSMRRERYITLTVRATTPQDAIITFQRLDGDVVAGMKRIGGAEARALKTKERIQILHDIYNLGSEEDFTAETYDFHTMVERGLAVKDYIAPPSFEFNSSYFKTGNKFARVLYLRDLPTSMHDNILADLTNVDFNCLLTLNLRPIAQEKALTLVRNQVVSINAAVVEAQKKATKAGYGTDLISPSLRQAQQEAAELQEDLTQRNQKMFFATLTMVLFADTLEELKSQTEEVQSIGRKHMCGLKLVSYQQEAAFNSSLPLGAFTLSMDRTLTSESSAIFMPFTSQELNQQNGMYYGTNAVSHNLILFNRLNCKNSNGIILGTPGSGKSFAAKREMLNVLLNTDADVVVIDPESEYGPMAELLGGEVIKIKTGGDVHINPMDMDMAYSSDEGGDPLALKSDFLLSLCETVMGGRYGLTPIQKSIIDRCVREVYQTYLATGRKSDIPTLNEFHEVLARQPDPEAREIAISLEIYVKGSLKIFASPTNVDTDNRFIVYDVRDMGANVKTMAMQIVLDSLWNRICENRNKGRRTWFYVDEIYLLFSSENSAAFLQQLWKRARKYGGVPTGITQNVEDLLKSETARTMLSNSDFVMMLNQATLDAGTLADLLHISSTQLSYITNADPGQGLLYIASNGSGQGGIIPFNDRFPTDTKMFKVMNTQMAQKSRDDD